MIEKVSRGVQDHVLSAAAVVTGGVLSITTEEQGKWSKLLLHITHYICGHVCVCVCVCAAFDWDTDMCLETLITFLKLQGCWKQLRGH